MDGESKKVDAAIVAEAGEWEPISGRNAAAGGQGTVVQVHHRHDGRIGAMKTLHPGHLTSKERRFRMQQEVFLLNLMDSDGVPHVLADNADTWKLVGTPMYAIVEWVDGPTLADFCNGRPQCIDDALAIVNGLVDIVRRCHAAGVIHRDIKPDNIILRNGNVSDVVLIDFGMGWAAPDEERFGEFATGAGQELGNRFLRLPEFAPGHHVRDTRSDVTMLVAILFYLLAGAAPRLLLDPEGRMPQEALLARFPIDTTSDSRWEGLRRIFKVGFQQRLDMRFLDVQQLADALASLSISVNSSMTNPLDEQLKRIRDLRESADGALLEQCQRNSLGALSAFFGEFIRRINEHGFEAGGQGPVVAEWGRAAKTTLFLSKQGAAEPKVGFIHQISFENGEFEASYSLVGEAVWSTLYKGPLADPDSLREAAMKSVDTILTILLDRYAIALEGYVARMTR